jgi:arylsulfatase A-like enzyme
MTWKSFFMLMPALLAAVAGVAQERPIRQASASASASAKASVDRQDRPNILFVLADDQRWDELACEGEPYLKTPTIDRLAGEGLRFSSAYVNSAICMVSRATIFSGLTGRTHQWKPGSTESLPLNDPTLQTCFPLLLRQAGYRTGYFGKNHVQFSGGTDRAFDTMFNEQEIISRNPCIKTLPDGSKRHCDEIMGDRSVGFVESQPADQPFFLYMNFHIAHASDGDHRPGVGHYPWPQAEDGLYEDIVPPRPELDDPAIYEAMPGFLKASLNRQRYFWRWDTPEKYNANMRARYRMITGMDRVIGRVLTVLEERGMLDNTIVIYSADNGYYRAERGFAGKWSHFEEALHVPLIIWAPKMTSRLPGEQEKALVSNIDLPSTILELADVQIPASYQGQSLLPFINGEAPAGWREDLFCEHHQFGEVIPAWSGIHGERYVYACYDTQDPPYEFLHDLQSDPKQLINFADNPEYRPILEKMRMLRKQRIEKYTAARIENRPAKPALETYKGGEVEFDGKKCVRLADTPALLPGDSYRWSFEVKIDPQCKPGAVLLGNRKTSGAPDLTFMKITANRGVQFFSNGGKLVLNAVIPRGRWVRVDLQKTGPTVTLQLDGKTVATEALLFALPAMPCYLGGDPKVPTEYARCSIRKASVSK